MMNKLIDENMKMIEMTNNQKKKMKLMMDIEKYMETIAKLDVEMKVAGNRKESSDKREK